MGLGQRKGSRERKCPLLHLKRVQLNKLFVACPTFDRLSHSRHRPDLGRHQDTRDADAVDCVTHGFKNNSSSSA